MDVFFLLLFAHALGDFGLQSPILNERKDQKKNPETWYIFLAAHSVIHGGLAGFFTGSFIIAVGETLFHALIDYAFNEEKFDMKTDQLLHIACKGVWMILLLQGLA